MSSAENEPLRPGDSGAPDVDAVAEAIASGRPVDWEAFEARHPNHRTLLATLRRFERLRMEEDRLADEFDGGPASRLVGTTVAHYRISEKLGEGGMGVVYRAHDPRLDRDIALKVLPPKRFGDETMRQNLQREARLAARVNHPNIITVHDVGEAMGCVYIAMELVEGRMLYTVARSESLGETTVLDYGRQIADALAAAHEAGIVHRDLKTRNILVARNGVVKVLDFGIASTVARSEARPGADSGAGPSDDARPPGGEKTHTTAAVCAGTLGYMAPEILRGAPGDARSDIWSLGVCLYEMLAGDRPFVDPEPRALERAILHDDPRDLPPSVSAPMRRLVARCLQKDPNHRYQTAREVREALEAIATPAPSGPDPDPSPPRPPRPPWRQPAVVMGIAVVALWAALGFLHDRFPDLVPDVFFMPHDPTVVVLPARNASGDSTQQYLADGLTDEMINGFAGIRRLRVMSRASSDAIDRSHRLTSEIARKYRIDYVLESTVSGDGHRLRVTARLVEARGDRARWSDTFERPVEEVGRLDDAIVLGVAAVLKAPLSAAERSRLRPGRAVSREAFQAYVRGRNLAMAREYPAALERFEAAARFDSAYAGAYAGIADVYTEMIYYHFVAAEEALPRAEAAAGRALSLDSTQADAHLALAFLHGLRWEWPEARRQLENALADAPGNPQVHYRWSLYYGVMNDGAASVSAMERAVRLDPASTRMAVELGLALMNARRLPAAEARFSAVLATGDGGDEVRRARAYRARCYALQGNVDRAIAELTDSLGVAPETDPIVGEELAYAYAAAGRAGDAHRVLKRMRAVDPDFPSPLAVAACELALGDRAGTLAVLGRAFARHDPRVLWIESDRRFDSIRGLPAYRRLAKSLGVPGAGGYS